MYLSPSDPAEMMLNAQGISVSKELIQSKRIELGLDKPFIEQYLIWLSNLLKGNLGISYSTGKSVLNEIKEHIPYTVLLTLTSIITTLIISIPLGIVAALKRNKFTDYIVRILCFTGNSMPGFFLGLVLLYIFALKLKILPILNESGIKSMILPTATLSIPMISKYTRQIRNAVIDELNKDYVKGELSRGVKKKYVYLGILKNIMITVITLIGLSLGSLLGGSVIIESIFVWPGIGNMALSAIRMRDYPLIQGYVIFTSFIFIIINLIIDLLYGILDPRIKTLRRK
ncbi:MAG TPA: nickel ABC transporter permease subunit NikB [Clostridium sp.]|nr:nickel ABC transporter permease subunit NikB [Clostridium sp.]